MSAAALVVSIVAVVLSGGSLAYVRRNTLVNVAADRRAREPRLTVTLDNPEFGGGVAFFKIANDDRQALDSVVVHAAEHAVPPGRVVLPSRAVGLMGHGDLGPQAEIGPLAKRAYAVLAVSVGPRVGQPEQPDLQVRIDVRAGRDRWTLVEDLPIPVDPSTQVF